MKRFVPREKLNKKARKAQDRRQRELWPVSPVTKVVPSQKIYNRKKHAHTGYDDSGMGVLML